jgi:predicted nucleic acid-binding protein
MGKKYLIDSNVLIDAEADILPNNGMIFLKRIVDEDFIVSFITYIEILGYNKVEKSVEDIMSLARVIEINKEIIEESIKLRRLFSIKLPDTIIAATALVYGYTLVTHNISDFKRIEGLDVIDPYDL